MGTVDTTFCYAGSFEPFHTGHLNILLKAESMFGKVVVARGVNPSKQALLPSKVWPKTIQDRDLRTFEGLITDFLHGLGEDTVLIRGLRNATDLHEELNYQRWLRELMPEIKICYITCDAEFEHVSSTAIRNLKQFGVESHHIVR